jgi:DNA ligase-1
MFIEIKKPMLAETLECESLNLHWPVLASPKLDGIRCVVVGGKALSRTLKPIPNKHIRDTLEEYFKNRNEVFDGEIMVGETFQECTSGIMTRTGTPDFKFHVFDVIKDDKKKTYVSRINDLKDLSSEMGMEKCGFISLVLPILIEDGAELFRLEMELLAKGFEGVMVRSVNSPYKEGRSTLKEEYLLKVKRYSQDEAVILGYEELMHNENEAEISETGNTKRSSHQENLVPANMLGALIVKDLVTGVDFKVGTGFTEEHRIELWDTKENLVGKFITYKHFPVGVLTKPRHPVFIGFRHPDDMSK